MSSASTVSISPVAAAGVGDVGLQSGLTSDEARRLLVRVGPNAIVDVAQHPVRRAFGKLWAPARWMLEAAILLQLGLGDYVEAGVLTFLLVFNAAIGFFQEGRAQATLDALKSRLVLMADRGWLGKEPPELLYGGRFVHLPAKAERAPGSARPHR